MIARARGEIVLGARGSELALVQAGMAAERLRGAGAPAVRIEIVRTRGDESAQPLHEIAGRKGVFTAELERALADGRIDVAVHSAKDLPSQMPPDFCIAAVLPRAGVEDLVLTKTNRPLAGLPEGATVATGSIRRERQLRWSRPDFKVIDLRGNVPTRLRKFAEADWDAVVLARAGLERLKFLPPRFDFEGITLHAEILPIEIFVPAGGQGIVALQTRAADSDLVSRVNDGAARVCLCAEREFLRLMGGDCGTPVGAHARMVNGNLLELRVQLFAEAPAPKMVRAEGDDPEKLAAEVFAKL